MRPRHSSVPRLCDELGRALSIFCKQDVVFPFRSHYLNHTKETRPPCVLLVWRARISEHGQVVSARGSVARRAVPATAEPVPEPLTPTDVQRTDRWPWLASLGAGDEDLCEGDPQAQPRTALPTCLCSQTFLSLLDGGFFFLNLFFFFYKLESIQI